MADTQVGDTITELSRPAAEPLPGYREVMPMVFSGVYPADGAKYQDLRDSLEKLKLNDASFVYEPESSIALGFGFRCGSVREYGLVPRRERDDDGTTFVQDNFYYLCQIDRAVGQDLDEYEAEEGFTPEFVDPRHAIETNLHHDHSGKESAMFPREAGVLQWLLDEGFFGILPPVD